MQRKNKGLELIETMVVIGFYNRLDLSSSWVCTENNAMSVTATENKCQ